MKGRERKRKLSSTDMGPSLKTGLLIEIKTPNGPLRVRAKILRFWPKEGGTEVELIYKHPATGEITRGCYSWDEVFALE